MLWEGFYHDFSTKKASASGGFPPDPHQGARPMDRRGNFTPSTIYAGATPELSPFMLVEDLHLEVTVCNCMCYLFACSRWY